MSSRLASKTRIEQTTAIQVIGSWVNICWSVILHWLRDRTDRFVRIGLRNAMKPVRNGEVRPFEAKDQDSDQWRNDRDPDHQRAEAESHLGALFLRAYVRRPDLAPILTI